MDILSRDKASLECSFESVNNSCRFACASGGGEVVYDRLENELKQSVGRLAQKLSTSQPPGMQWLASLVNTCRWFESQVVSATILERPTELK